MNGSILVDFWHSIHRDSSLFLVPGTCCRINKIVPSCKRMDKFRQTALCIRELITNKDMGGGKDANENLLGFHDF